MVSDEELLKNLRKFADDIGKTPSCSEMAAHGPHSRNTYANRFGSWNDALRAAGLEPNQTRTKGYVTDQELLDEIQKIHEETGRTPRYGDIEDHPEYSPSAFAVRFGSWTGALYAAGFEPVGKGNNGDIRDPYVDQ